MSIIHTNAYYLHAILWLGATWKLIIRMQREGGILVLFNLAIAFYVLSSAVHRVVKQQQYGHKMLYGKHIRILKILDGQSTNQENLCLASEKIIDKTAEN